MQVLILPFMEQEALYSQINFAPSAGHVFSQTIDGRQLARHVIGGFQCPSDLTGLLPSTDEFRTDFRGYAICSYYGNAEVAVRVKATEKPSTDHLKGLRAWREEQPHSRCMLVCRAARGRRTDDGIEIIPWRDFLRRLWRPEIRAPSNT
jgi:hypothetical protein